MKKQEMISMFSEGLSAEEVLALSTLEELRELVLSSNLDEPLKKKLLSDADHLVKDTIRHSQIFTELLKEAVK